MRIFSTFKSGDVVPTSGVYAALHSTPHRLVERTMCVEGDRFHRCRLCPLGVLYRLEELSIPMSPSINWPSRGLAV